MLIRLTVSVLLIHDVEAAVSMGEWRQCMPLGMLKVHMLLA